MRCGYTVVPKELKFNGVSLNPLWARRQATKFNGVSYITQRAAEAIYSEEGKSKFAKHSLIIKRTQELFMTVLSTQALNATAA